MPYQLPDDCLNEIFEYLENNRATLCSCLLVNHLWCEVSVRILWRRIRSYNTLISFLPKESKEILYKNEIIITSTTSKPPLFNYIKFIKSLSIDDLDSIIKKILKNYKNDQSIIPQSPEYIVAQEVVAQEVYKLFMGQIYSLRELNFKYCYLIPTNINFTSYPGAKDCLKNLTKLTTGSTGIYPEFFYQLSQVCHNIQFLNIEFERVISNGLTDLISVQQNLKYLEIHQDCRSYKYRNTTIISLLVNLPNTLIKLDISGHSMPLSLFIDKFTNLQELVLSFDDDCYYPVESCFSKDFSRLQYITFSQLQILKFNYRLPKTEFLIRFLETNGRSLKELNLNPKDYSCISSLNSLNLSITKFCPNIKILSIILDGELKTLKEIFNNCQYLESIEIWCENLNENELWEVVTKHSPKNFYECILENMKPELLPEELESIFINWMNRTPLKPLSVKYYAIKKFDEIMEVIEKYKKLGIIKKFDISYIS